jgi:ABC-type multidrug transport system ATPase subunit
MTLKLSFSKLGSIKLDRQVEITIGKTLLYGPSGHGKSTIIRALVRIIHASDNIVHHLTQDVDDKNYWRRLSDSSDAVLYLPSNKVADLRNPGADSPRTARIVGDTLYLYTKSDCREPSYIALNAVSSEGLREILSEPEIAERAEEFFAWLDVPIIDFYHGYYKEKGLDWLDISNLSYGYRRALMMIYALEKSDYLFIEGFESGLHMGLMKKLLDLFNESDGKVIVIETHDSGSLTLALKTGWTAYYVKRDEIIEFTNYDQLREKADIFLKELASVLFEQEVKSPEHHRA